MASETIPLTVQRHERSTAFPKGSIDEWGFIPVTLKYGRNVVRRIDTLIDTGASTTVYSKSIADDLCIDLLTGDPEGMGGVGGTTTAWYHTVKLSFKGWAYHCKVGFVDNELPVAGIFGYLGFFDRFKYTIDSSNDNCMVERLPKIYK